MHTIPSQGLLNRASANICSISPNRVSVENYIRSIPILRRRSNAPVSRELPPNFPSQRYTEVVLYCDEYDPRPPDDFYNFQLAR